MGRLHDEAAWHRRARRQLQCEPLCAMCLSEGRIIAAKIADHITPHRNDPHAFWTGQLQSLCANCHESRKKFVEHRGYGRTMGLDGLPTDPRGIRFIEGRKLS